MADPRIVEAVANVLWLASTKRIQCRDKSEATTTATLIVSNLAARGLLVLDREALAGLLHATKGGFPDTLSTCQWCAPQAAAIFDAAGVEP